MGKEKLPNHVIQKAASNRQFERLQQNELGSDNS